MHDGAEVSVEVCEVADVARQRRRHAMHPPELLGADGERQDGRVVRRVPGSTVGEAPRMSADLGIRRRDRHCMSSQIWISKSTV